MIEGHLAQIQIHPSDMPLSGKDRDAFILWLRQVAQEVERGDHWDTSIFTLGRDRHAREFRV